MKHFHYLVGYEDEKSFIPCCLIPCKVFPDIRIGSQMCSQCENMVTDNWEEQEIVCSRIEEATDYPISYFEELQSKITEE